MKKNFLLTYILLSFVYLEIAFKLIVGLDAFNISTFFVCLCALIFGTLLLFVIDVFKRKGKIIATSFILFIFGIYFSAHTCLFRFYKFYFQFSALALLDQAAAFASDGLKVITNNALYILIYFLPFLLFVTFLRRFVSEERTNIKLSIIVIGFSLLFYLPFALDPYGYVNKTFETGSMAQVVNKNGVYSGLFFDIYKTISGGDSSIIVDDDIQEEETEDIEYAYNTLDIDFNTLNTITTNNNIIDLNNYFASKTPSKQNEYTSFFEGKNLILFMAESFNGICINPDLTPTLYKLAHSGFEFTNFYTPTNFSTIGGEFTELTSLYADLGPLPNTLSIFRSNTNSYPMGIGNLFKQKGYTTYAYHDSSYDFQDRNIYLHNLGFDNYNACGLGLEKKINCRNWPASDIEMIDATFDDYISDDNFLVFYASVSGHGPYLFDKNEDNIAPKYKEMLKEYYGDSLGNDGASEILMAYEAGQMELDRALETLINKLQAAGKLDDTVIALVGDHHPYYITDNLTMDQYNRLSTYERDRYIELYHSNFILYNSAMDTVTIDKVGSQLDVIPTLYNLFGMDFDSRLLMGNDLLSSSSSIAIMSDDSWITDYGRYYATSEKFEASEDMMLGDSYVELINKKVRNIQKLSILIMKNNYYKFVYDNK